MSVKTLGAMQQAGYQNKGFMGWLSRKDNLLFNRLCVLALCLVLASCITSLCFSVFGTKIALLISAVPFFLLLLLYLVSDRKYALKVPIHFTARLKRLYALYVLFVAIATYAVIAFLAFLSKWNGSILYHLIAYVPFALLVPCLPFLCVFANACLSPFEKLNNAKYVKRAGQVLDETKIIRVGVVGSYAKTSIKHILKTILEEKYSVVATPQSYNTPMGLARTILSEEFAGKEVLIAEMGARKAGDIQELTALIQPDFAVFTGVCEQHIASFGSIENVFAEKSEIVKSGAFCVCGEGLQARINDAFEEQYISEAVMFGGRSNVLDLQLLPTQTKFTLRLGDESIAVTTALLGEMAAENIALAAMLAYEGLGLTIEEIARGIEKLQPVPHRLQLLKSGGAYVLDDAYNSNIAGAKQAIDVLARFDNSKYVVTPGLVECGILEESLNGELGAYLAQAALDKVILVGQTLVGAVKKGYVEAGGAEEKLLCVKTLKEAQDVLATCFGAGDCVLFLNDLPDVY